jgi:hypothetical protein
VVEILCAVQVSAGVRMVVVVLVVVVVVVAMNCAKHTSTSRDNLLREIT